MTWLDIVFFACLAINVIVWFVQFYVDPTGNNFLAAMLMLCGSILVATAFAVGRQLL